MKKYHSISLVWGFVISLVILGGLLLLYVVINSPQETLSQCLTKKGGIMYGHELCNNCINQKKLFGDDFKNIKYVNCQFEPEKCRAMGINYYPVWVLGGKILPGMQDLKAIAVFAGCDYQN